MFEKNYVLSKINGSSDVVKSVDNYISSDITSI